MSVSIHSHWPLGLTSRNTFVFEDSLADPPVSYDRIYPEGDPIVSKLPKVSEGTSSDALDWEPPMTSLKEPDAEVFFSIARSWLGSASEAQKSTVGAICRLHAAVTSRSTVLPSELSTLHHLHDVVEAMMVGAYVGDVHGLLKFYYVRYISPLQAADAFVDCVTEAHPEWEPVVVELIGST